jgi:hypothetical protein
MIINDLRLKSAFKATGLHFLASVLVTLIVAAVVFGIWFPYNYRQMAGGTELFLIIISVDLVCGPMLTLVLFNPAKRKSELLMDLSLVIVLQLTALAYGVWTVHQARPLYLVYELDRFKVIALPDINIQELSKLPKSLQPQLFKGPQTTGLKEVSNEEREKVMFESVQGGRDFGERPSFYTQYDASQANKAFAKAKPLADFGKKHPNKQTEVDKLQIGLGSELLRYLPIIARQDWIAVLNPKGEIVGYIKGDGF